jgi:glycosyltransferase involved in cell wall biosynthesis
MINTNTKKICIVVTCLGGGGAERSSAMLSEMLYDIGHDVHVVTVLDIVDYKYKGKLLNLGKLKAEDDSILGRIKRFKTLKLYLNKYKFDYVIDNRTRIGFIKEFIISKFLYKGIRTIYMVHSFKVENYMNPQVFYGRFLYSKAFKIVAVSDEIKNELEGKYRFGNVVVIHNATSTEIYNFKNEMPTSNYILFFGRLDDKVKNITLLLNAYKLSVLKSKSINLKILGDGKDLKKLKQTVLQLNQEDSVQFLPYKSNPYTIVQNAMFTVLTSRYEGFPMVIPESLALGVPVVSVDCKSGPSEIVMNEHNGLLVENHNVQALANAMNRMVADKELYLRCKSNAKSSVAHLSKEAIGRQWQLLLK